MIALLDVGYRTDHAVAACVVAERWTDDRAVEQRVAHVADVAPYEPGRFYLRELPCLLAVLRLVRAEVTTIVVDGYVFLGPGRPGLGAHLHEVTRVPVVGVAKTEFRGASAIAVTRGGSSRALFVTAAGIDPSEAASYVRQMHGPFRTPTLLRLVDRLTRA